MTAAIVETSMHSQHTGFATAPTRTDPVTARSYGRSATSSAACREVTGVTGVARSPSPGRR